jgi:hypothetical protein
MILLKTTMCVKLQTWEKLPFMKSKKDNNNKDAHTLVRNSYWKVKLN